MPETHAHLEPEIGSREAVIAFTDKAVERVKSVMKKENLGPNYRLRVAVTSGGCSGMSYAMSFDDSPRDGDAVVEADGLRVLVDRESVPYLRGITIDYVEGLHSAGFKFVNPNATRTCGCGTSFSA